MADKPMRIQLSRAKGWRMPPNTCVVTRATIFGNPFKISDARDAGYKGDDAALAAKVVRAFDKWLRGSAQDWMGPESDAARAAILARLPELRGKNLACFCKPGTPCHADVLLEIANA